MSGSGIKQGVLLIWIYYLSGCKAQVSIVIGPRNEALLQTETITLQCKVEQDDAIIDYIAWEECITNGDGTCRRISNDEAVVYAALGGDPVRGARYSISNPQPKQYNLIIIGVLMADAGKYWCLSRNDANVFRDADIVVIEQEPSCTRNTTNDEAIQGDYVSMTCDVTYQGRWAPRMNWKVNGQGYTGNIIDESTGDTIRQSIVVQVEPNNDGDLYSMDTNFAEPTDTTEKEADNKPAYVDSNSFKALTVYYPPYSMTLSPDKASYQPGETISCSAVAKPVAQYIWTDSRTTEIISQSSILTISTDMLGSQTYMCRGYNQYGNDAVLITLNVYMLHADCKVKTMAVGMLSALLVASIIAHIVTVVYVSRTRCPCGKTERMTPEELSPGNTSEDVVMESRQMAPQYESVKPRDPVLPSVYEAIAEPSEYENPNNYENVNER